MECSSGMPLARLSTLGLVLSIAGLLACLPLFHIGGLSILMRSVIHGVSVIVHKKFDPFITNHAICEDEITIISVVAVMLQRMLAALDSNGRGAGYPSTLRCVLLGGGPVPYPLLEAC